MCFHSAIVIWPVAGLGAVIDLVVGDTRPARIVVFSLDNLSRNFVPVTVEDGPVRRLSQQ